MLLKIFLVAGLIVSQQAEAGCLKALYSFIGRLTLNSRSPSLIEKISIQETKISELISELNSISRIDDKAIYKKINELERNYAYLLKLSRKAYRQGLTPYAPVGMKKQYVGESSAYSEAMNFRKVSYMNDEELRKNLIRVGHDGKIYKGDDNVPYSTKENLYGEMYVMSPRGEIFIRTSDISPRSPVYRHSSFFMGKPVAAAGYIRIINGEIEFLDNNSGHYAPKLKLNHQFVEELAKKGYDTKKLKMMNYKSR